MGLGIKITLHALFTSSQLHSSKKPVKWWLVLMAKVNVYEVCCAFCIQVPVSAVDGSRLPGVGTARVYHIAWCCDVSASCESCLPCRHSTRCGSSTSEWPCIAGAVDKHWLVTYLWSPYVIGQSIYIFMLWFVLLSSSFFSSPNLSRHRLDVCHTSTHGVALVRI